MEGKKMKKVIDVKCEVWIGEYDGDELKRKVIY
jgi:hypothetical protein